MILFLTSKRGHIFWRLFEGLHMDPALAFSPPEDQLEAMATECTRLLKVTEDFFFRAAGWHHLNRLENV
jgi:hypothetical protein